MNVLICGSGKGSFEMRGRQIGAALGARVTSDPTAEDWAWANVVILLKRTATSYAPAADAANVPIVWDVLDCWGQPHQNQWSVDQGIDHVGRLARQIKPAAMIGATEKMAADIGGVYIPHHCRIGLHPTPPRDEMKVIAYDGSERYLGAWEPAIRAECDRRGWSFVINPLDLAKVDVLVAFRDGYWDGPICRAWKSGVKYVNALCAGRPIVTQTSPVCLEIDPPWLWADTVDSLRALLNVASDHAERIKAYEHGLVHFHKFTVDAIAETYYRPLLQRVCEGAQCAA